jgi:CheY-like chemotaxis protein
MCHEKGCQGMGVPVLVVNSDPIARKYVRQVLENADYDVMEAGDTESGLATLRMSEHSMVVIFNLVLFNYVMTGTDDIAFLGAAASDRHLAANHGFVIVTPTAEQLEIALGHLIHRLSIPIVAEPFTSNDLLEAVAIAESRLVIPV